jgi:hypothetical protein
MLRKIATAYILITVVALSVSSPALAVQWETLKTKYLTLYYHSDKDLDTFDKKIKPVEKMSRFSSFSSGNFYEGPRGDLAKKVDTLVEKVQLILDMRKPIKINVRIYPDKAALKRAYFRIYKNKKDLRAWYIFEYNTVYLQVGDLFSGMFAHEVAHAIVDHYLDVRPPRATSEILARYVDAHLNKEATVY